jgi:hypothetical protein
MIATFTILLRVSSTEAQTLISLSPAKECPMLESMGSLKVATVKAEKRCNAIRQKAAKGAHRPIPAVRNRDCAAAR